MNGIFAVNKPSGPTSHDIVHKIRDLFVKSPLFEDDVKRTKLARTHGKKKFRKDRLPPIKVGHGGTLDPLADGVLVIGVGNGTKELPKYLGNCTKVYQAIALLGATTDTYDSEGKLIGVGKTENITNEMIEQALPKLRGEISQTPPIFSALKMGGKKLYDYARSGQPLPKEIEERKVTIYELDVIRGLDWDHQYSPPRHAATEEEKKLSIQFEENTIAKKGLASPQLNYDGVLPDNYKPGPILEIKFSVSSGTYIRTLIHDLGLALGCGAHMVKLTRLQQGAWKLGENVFEVSDFTEHSEEYWGSPLIYYLKSGPGQMIEGLYGKEREVKESRESGESRKTDTVEIDTIEETPHN